MVRLLISSAHVCGCIRSPVSKKTDGSSAEQKKRDCRTKIMHGSTLIIVLTGVLLYLVMGALVFNALEAPYEESHHNELQNIRNEFLGNYTCVDQDHLEVLINVSEVNY